MVMISGQIFFCGQICYVTILFAVMARISRRMKFTEYPTGVSGTPVKNFYDMGES
ncbi:MAG: 4Fe-4S binding protein [Desulfarculales bacterium]|jgi:hypothetical protein|nr:4Fe-4S binding protein [Desulfarculales bacterium]